VNAVLLVIAGPNGAGKTTVTARLRADHWSEGVEYINPDDIAQERFGDWNSPDAVLRAWPIA
jgi:predicted ABC-type ATPase